MTVWGRIYRTSLLRSIQPLFPQTRAAEDVVATARVADSARGFAYSNFGFYTHIPRRFGSLTSSDGYARLALESLSVLSLGPQRRLTKIVTIASSASYFARRGEFYAAGSAAGLAVRSLIL